MGPFGRGYDTMSKDNKPARYGPSYPGDYPPEMRRQLWPLCCGAAIISGFKAVNQLSDEELVDEITHAVTTAIPDHQVFANEQMRPALTFLTLNSSQMGSPKIMSAIKKAGFVQFATARPRGSDQGFFIKDTSDSFKAVA